MEAATGGLFAWIIVPCASNLMGLLHQTAWYGALLQGTGWRGLSIGGCNGAPGIQDHLGRRLDGVA